ncbi:FAD-binding and (Fe-S)-binding domain-containing protein [Embleya sp. NBC_00896]|uniref:FAD-binding and (Fe-S)-binding domain-containing protein n=1 Tax=Embleya sp. NBC_00896 TaxID=2975961 RepID=UPI003864AEB0|nr:FAD-binding oxidoreductase [Embleya sp. NBC_00896]
MVTEQPGDLEGALRARVRGEVRFDPQARALYSMDASNHRRVPPGVVAPLDADDVLAALAVCRELRAPVTVRGGGTSIAGQATGNGVVLDLARHLTRVHDVDPVTRIAHVEPGVVLDDLRREAGRHGLTFGPDPSTHSRCTLGGMIGNDACGSHSVAWGRTSANVVWLDIATMDGTRMRVGPGQPVPTTGRGAEIHAALTALADANLALIRRGFPALPRRVSGYALDRLLPENGRDVARALVGTEGTCVVVLGAGVRLVEAPKARVLAVLGFADDFAAADAAPRLLAHGPLTVESLNAGLVALAASARDVELPAGAAWLFVEVGADTVAEAEARAHALTGADPALVVSDPAGQRALWRIREEASGTATRMADGSEAWPGWEDTAVPPERLGAYLRELAALLERYDLRGLPYGHFGEGCVHIRIDFDLLSARGVAAYRAFSAELADLVVAHDGSLSGEHGDGQARAEFLPRMYGPEIVELFGRFKAIWDPADLLNPGILVHPHPVDGNLRFTGMRTPVAVEFGYPADGGDFAAAVRRCVGVGKCRESADTASGGVMCPSFRVTGEEAHSTRGRARLLHEMLIGDVITDGWRSTEVHDALDLCLSCKGCRSDCPVDVDMATYKAEFLHHHYKGRLRPAAHYALGNLPLWARAVGALPGLAGAVNAAAGVPALRRAALGLAGLDRTREIPPFAAEPFTRWWRDRPRTHGSSRPRVVLWPDTFTNRFTPEVARSAVAVLEAAGLAVVVPPGPVCCGLTWVSTGQLGIARRVLARTLRTLRPALDAGLPIIGLEPSCTAALRTDVPELMGRAADGLAASVKTFAQALEEYAPHWSPPVLDREVTGQLHCHQHAVLGDAADRRLRARAGLTGELAGGCCGLAGNFGYEAGHGDLSRAVAADRLLPALAAASPDAVTLADGFSCRTQITHVSERRPRHVAELLAAGLPAPADRTPPSPSGV